MPALIKVSKPVNRAVANEAQLKPSPDLLRMITIH